MPETFELYDFIKGLVKAFTIYEEEAKIKLWVWNECNDYKEHYRGIPTYFIHQLTAMNWLGTISFLKLCRSLPFLCSWKDLSGI